MIKKTLIRLTSIMMVCIMMLFVIVPENGLITDAASIKINASLSMTSSETGGKITVKATGSAGVSPYQYKFQYKINSGSWKVIKNFSTSNTASFTTTSAGTYTIRSYVKDKNNLQIFCDITTTVKAKTTLLVNNSTINKTSLDLGNSVVISAKASGGTAPYNFAYNYKIQDGASKTFKSFSTTTSATIKLPSAGYYTIQCIVKDKNGKQVTKSFNVTVKKSSNTKLVNNTTLSANVLTLGSVLKINGKGTGGSQPYVYSYFYSLNGGVYNKIVERQKSAAGSIKLPSVGFYKIKTVVNDISGKISTKIINITVKRSTGSTLTNNSKISCSDLVERYGTVNLTGSASGGSEPYFFAYSYRIGDGAWNKIKDYSAEKSQSLKLSEVNKYTLKISVKDADNKVREKFYVVYSIAKISPSKTVSSVYGHLEDVNIADKGSGTEYAVYYKKSSEYAWNVLKSYSTDKSAQIRPRYVGTYNILLCYRVSGKVTKTCYNLKTYIPNDVYKELQLVNDERVRCGVSRIDLDTDLVYAAQIRAEELKKKYSHSKKKKKNCFTVLKENGIFDYTYTGENIAWGYPSVETVMTGWNNSKGHHDNIMDPGLKKIGIGMSGNYWSQIFTD